MLVKNINKIFSGVMVYWYALLFTALIISYYPLSSWLRMSGMEFTFTVFFYTMSLLKFLNVVDYKKSFLIISIFSVLSALSSINGIIVFTICFLLLLYYRFPKKYCIYYSILFCSILIIYLVGVTSVAKQMHIVSSVYASESRIKMFFTFLADIFHLSIFGNYANLITLFIGLFAFSLWVFLVCRSMILTVKKKFHIDCVPWIALGILPVTSAVLLALFRIQYGENQAFADRYEAYTALFWISLFVLLKINIQSITNKKNKISLVMIAIVMYFAVIAASFIGLFNYTDPTLYLRVMNSSLGKNTYIANTAINVYIPKTSSPIGQIYGYGSEELQFAEWQYLRDHKLSFARKLGSFKQFIDLNNITDLSNNARLQDIIFSAAIDQFSACKYGFNTAHGIQGNLIIKNWQWQFLRPSLPELVFISDEEKNIIGSALFDIPFYKFLYASVGKDVELHWLGYIHDAAKSSSLIGSQRNIKVYLNASQTYYIGSLEVPTRYACV